MSTETAKPSTSRPAFTQTRVPTSLQGSSRFKRDPDRHYMLVEGDNPTLDYESHLSYYLDEVTDQSGETPYVTHGYVPGECKSKRWTLISCSKSYYNFMMKTNDQVARQMLMQPEGIRTNDQSTTVSISQEVQNGGRAFTVDQLQSSFGLRDAVTGWRMGKQVVPAEFTGDNSPVQ